MASPPSKRPSRCADALHDQQTARGGHELILANGVIHIRHYHAVSRDDRSTEDGGAEVQYPPRRLVRYEGDNREQGCGGRERRGDDDKASVEAVRKPADRPSQEKPAKGSAGHQDGNSAGIEAQPLRKDRAQSHLRDDFGCWNFLDPKSALNAIATLPMIVANEHDGGASLKFSTAS